MSNIRVAESAGFCFGVKRAIEWHMKPLAWNQSYIPMDS